MYLTVYMWLGCVHVLDCVHVAGLCCMLARYAGVFFKGACFCHLPSRQELTDVCAIFFNHDSKTVKLEYLSLDKQ